jgi:hypothetical protein
MLYLSKGHQKAAKSKWVPAFAGITVFSRIHSAHSKHTALPAIVILANAGTH